MELYHWRGAFSWEFWFLMTEPEEIFMQRRTHAADNNFAFILILLIDIPHLSIEDVQHASHRIVSCARFHYYIQDIPLSSSPQLAWPKHNNS